MILKKVKRKEDFEKIISNLLSWFTKYNCLLFGISKKNITTIKSFLGAINSIFNNYGIKINYLQKRIYEDRIKISKTYYTFVLDKNFKFFI